ncbi:MAG: Uma2 family endonuclease [Oscillatoriales cyanobacterium SM2_2_1]|nr:Uma2 family endonuclease [Oscillatoriales cyanobacterium SM2_2_1]
MTIATERILEDKSEAPADATTWQMASWEAFLSLCQHPANQKAKAYYFRGVQKFTMGVGAMHGDINAVIFLVLSFYCTIRGISHRAFVNTSYRKEGLRECQPDLSYYFSVSADRLPTGSGIVNLGQYAPPNLVIEIADSSLSDDVGIKRLLYEEMQVQEYWVVDAQKLELIAFAIDENLGSHRIRESIALPGLSLDAIAEALQKSRELDNAQLGQWWMEKIKI